MTRPFLYILIVLTVIVLAISAAIIILLPENSEEAAKPVSPVIPVNKPLPPDALAGEKLYERYCIECHSSLKAKSQSTLRNISERHEAAFLYKFITAEDKLMESGDEVTQTINADWGDNKYTHKFKLTQKQVDDILRYLNVNQY